jgi:replication-associated recombination protein RarA
MDLFTHAMHDRMRPRTLDEFAGQEEYDRMYAG